MTWQTLYWILMLLWLVGGVGWGWRDPSARPVMYGMGIPFVLFCILGWLKFGPPVH